MLDNPRLPYFPAIDYILRIKELLELRNALGGDVQLAAAIDLMLAGERASLRALVDATRPHADQ